MIANKLEHIVPYKNNETAVNVYGNPIVPSKSKVPYKKMEAWRVNAHGVQARFKKTNFLKVNSINNTVNSDEA